MTAVHESFSKLMQSLGGSSVYSDALFVGALQGHLPNTYEQDTMYQQKLASRDHSYHHKHDNDEDEFVRLLSFTCLPSALIVLRTTRAREGMNRHFSSATSSCNWVQARG